jgi:hypothetical protein
MGALGRIKGYPDYPWGSCVVVSCHPEFALARLLPGGHRLGVGNFTQGLNNPAPVAKGRRKIINEGALGPELADKSNNHLCLRLNEVSNSSDCAYRAMCAWRGIRHYRLGGSGCGSGNRRPGRAIPRPRPSSQSNMSTAKA